MVTARSDGPNASADIAPASPRRCGTSAGSASGSTRRPNRVIAVAAEAIQHFDELAANEPGRPAAAVKIRVHGSAAGRCDTRSQCAARRSLPKEVQDLLAWSSQRLGRSWAQPDPGDAGEGGKRR